MTTDTVVSHSSTLTANSTTSNNGNSKTTSTPWFLYLMMIIILPFMFGYSISMWGMIHWQTNTMSNHHYDFLTTTVTTPIRRLLSSLRIIGGVSTSNSNNFDIHPSSSSASFVPNMDLERCFQQLERRLFESNTSPQWDIFDGISIFVHRNGQAHSCGNFSSDTTTTANNDSDRSKNTTDPTLTSSPSSVQMVFRAALQDLYHLGQSCPDFSNKYHVESFLTRLLVHFITSSDSIISSTSSSSPEQSQEAGLCHSEDDDIHKRKTRRYGLYDFCDMGEEKTPILLDHNKLIPNTIVQYSSTNDGTLSPHRTYTFLPCHFHTEHGLRVTSLLQLTRLLQQSPKNTVTATAESAETALSNCIISPDGEETCHTNPASTSNVPTINTLSQPGLHLYAVPAGRVFMHVAAYIGQEIPLDHVPGADPNQRVYLKVLSVSPAVFDLYNFFTKEESAELVTRALAETKESHRIKRSTTGTGEHHVNTRRTSESGFDTDGATSILIKKRCFQVLGFDEYIESHGDGLQILRYNQTTAYIPHMDYLDLDKRLEHDYDSSKKGGNRFATILLYMTDLAEKDGGETVFIDAWPTGQREEDHVPIEKALRELRESDQHGILEEGSWQEKMVAQCRSRLAIRPDSARAVLFYSQLPNGQPDPKSKHGGCPVLSGVKYAANLWVWNTPRDGYAGNPKNPDYKPDKNAQKKKKAADEGIPPGRVTATFRNSGKDIRLVNAKLYFYDGSADKEWGSLGFDEQLSIYTYKTHVWKVMADGELFHTYTIDSDQPTEQEFVV